MALGSKVTKTTVYGEEVHIRSLNGGKNAARVIEMLQQVGAKPALVAEIGALLVVACLVDADGRQLYTDPEAVREEAAIGFLSAFTEAALTASGLGDDAAALSGNSQAVQ